MYSKCIHCLFLPVDITQNLPRCSQCILHVLHHISEQQASCTWVGGCWCSCWVRSKAGWLQTARRPGRSDRSVSTLSCTWDSHLGQPMPSLHPKGKGAFCTATLFLPALSNLFLMYRQTRTPCPLHQKCPWCGCTRLPWMLQPFAVSRDHKHNFTLPSYMVSVRKGCTGLSDTTAAVGDRANSRINQAWILSH